MEYPHGSEGKRAESKITVSPAAAVQVYPVSIDEAVDIMNANFASLGIAASISSVLLLLNTWAAWLLRRRIKRDGRFYEPLEEHELQRTKQP